MFTIGMFGVYSKLTGLHIGLSRFYLLAEFPHNT